MSIVNSSGFKYNILLQTFTVQIKWNVWYSSSCSYQRKTETVSHSCSLINFHKTWGSVSPTNTDSPSGLTARSCGWSNPWQNKQRTVVTAALLSVITRGRRQLLEHGVQGPQWGRVWRRGPPPHGVRSGEGLCRRFGSDRDDILAVCDSVSCGCANLAQIQVNSI